MEWQTLDSQVAYTCDGFDVVSETVELPDGERGPFDYLHNPESVVVLPFVDDEQVVVIDEWRHAVRRVNRGLPAGTLDDGEDPETAAERELAEETGYRPGSVEHLTAVEPANGFSDAVFHYVLARECERVTDQQLDRDETIEATTVPFEELLAAVRNGELRDGRSAFAVLAYLLAERRL